MERVGFFARSESSWPVMRLFRSDFIFYGSVAWVLRLGAVAVDSTATVACLCRLGAIAVDSTATVAWVRRLGAVAVDSTALLLGCFGWVL